MANASKSLEERLEELGNSLASSPDSSEELVSLLDLADELLSRVEQSPSQSMLTRLKPLMSALVAKELLRHSDTDVKAAVASCISEITRITAPEAPYEDDIMKEIFQMIVGAFEGLHDTSSRSFTKRVSVLETVAKVRSCVVMLDLECDTLILEMFHHFLNTIRSNHSENVYSAMETIMTLVIEESEEISLELLSCLLIVVKKDNKDVLPIARKLVEQVIGGCANKLKPYLLEFVQSTGALLSDYSKVVASICQQSSDAVGNNEINTLGEIVVEDSKLSERTVSDEMLQEQEIGCPEKVGIVSENSQKEALNNGTVHVGNSDAIAQPPSPKQKPERSRCNGPSIDAVDASLVDCDNPEPVAVKPDGSLDLNPKAVKGRKSSSAQLTDTTDHSRVGSDKETPAVSSERKSHSKEAERSEMDDLSAKEEMSAGSLDPEKKNEHNSVLENTSPDGASQNPSESLPEATRSKRGRQSRRKTTKQNVANAVAGKSAPSCSQKDALGNSRTQDDETPSKNDKTEPEGISRSEGKTERRSGKKLQLDVAAMDEEAVTVTSNTKIKPQRQRGKKGFKRKVIERDISGKKPNSNIKQKGEVALEDDVPGEPSLKDDVSSPGTPSKVPNIDESHLDDSKKPATSRKRFRGTENVLIPETSDHKEEQGDNIVGSKIRVWWPDDKKFYDGAITSFDHTSKMHKVVYTDGDVEVLLLKNERWEFAGGNTKIDGGKEKDIQGTDTSPMIRSKASRGTSNSLSKQPKTPSHSKSGNESSDKSGTKPRGRPRSGASNLEKFDDSPIISKKSKGRVVLGHKAKTSTSAVKLKAELENKPLDATPSGIINDLSKHDTSKSSSKSKNAPTRSGRNSKVSKSSSKLEEETPKPSSKSSEGTPKSGSQSEVDVVGGGNKVKQGRISKKRNKPDLLTPNGASSKEKVKVHENENTADAQDGTSTKRKKRRARK
ncbi:claspin [Iris pallida]|uniref:Claspin n=1 Tax=Iris pallida TaxID=29817 RepID=A0AAX6ERB3_IRIPA|nr:claspin [Iris pallida]